jgi:hypothetical protein
VWRLVQDDVNPDLFFAGTEFGLFFTLDGGERWIELVGGVPTISFRDLAIQRREDDLVAASFGRGLYVFDDYAPLRSVDAEALDAEAHLFNVRPAPWYIPRRTLGQPGRADQGAGTFVADNPPFGAIFTYHLAEDLTTNQEARRKAESELEKDGKDTPHIGFASLEKERRQSKPEILLTVRDASGEVVRTVPGRVKRGFHRVAWDLRYPPTKAIELVKSPPNPWERGGSGRLAPPGSYTVSLSKRVGGIVTELDGPVSFDVVRIFPGSLEGTPPAETAEYMARVAELNRAVTAADEAVKLAFGRIDRLSEALAKSTTAPGTLDGELEALRQELYEADGRLAGNRSLAKFSLPREPNIAARLRLAGASDGQSDYGPTATHRRSFEIAVSDFAALLPELKRLLEVELPALEAEMEAVGVPWSPGRPLPEVDGPPITR